MRIKELTGSMPESRATEVAIDALTFLAADTERLGRFLGETGMDASDLRANATDAGVQAALLGYLRSDDSLLMVFCGMHATTPEQVEQAEFVLGGPSGETGAL